LVVVDEGWSKDATERDDQYYEHEHEYAVLISEAGKNLAIGFDVATSDSARCWAHFDDMVLIVDKSTGIDKAKLDMLSISNYSGEPFVKIAPP
jgi:hypothetical protein